MIEEFKRHWQGYREDQTLDEVYGTLLRGIPPPQTSVAFAPKHFGAGHLAAFDAATPGEGVAGAGAGSP